MDPDVTLDLVIAAAQLIVDAEDDDELGEGGAAQLVLHNAPELAAGVLDLHKWIEKGGFLPFAWRGKRDLELAVRELTRMIENQILQGAENVARRIACVLDTVGHAEE